VDLAVVKVVVVEHQQVQHQLLWVDQVVVAELVFSLYSLEHQEHSDMGFQVRTI
jgi:hypothetical protein